MISSMQQHSGSLDPFISPPAATTVVDRSAAATTDTRQLLCGMIRDDQTPPLIDQFFPVDHPHQLTVCVTPLLSQSNHKYNTKLLYINIFGVIIILSITLLFVHTQA